VANYIQSVPSAQLPPIPSIPKNINPSLVLVCLLIGGLWVASLILPKPQIANGALASPSDQAQAYRIARKSEYKFWVPDRVGAGPRPLKSSSLCFPYVNTSFLAIGRAGVGKTFGVLNPMLFSAMEKGLPIALYDFKFRLDGKKSDRGQAADLLRTAIQYGYEVRFFVPGSPFSGVYDFLAAIKDSSDVAASKELTALLGNNFFSPDRKKEFFDRAGESLVSGSFLLSRWIAEQIGDPSCANFLMASALIDGDLSKRLRANEHKINPITFSRFNGLLTAKNAEKQEAGILGIASELLEPLTYPEFIPSYCGTPDTPRFKLDGKPHDPYLMQGKCLFVIGVLKEYAASSIPLAAAVISQTIKRNLSLDRFGPIVFGADEISTINVDLPSWLAQERSNYFSALIGAQNFAQLKKTYGDNDARTILGNIGGKAWFNPGELETAQMLSAAAGKKQVDITTKNYSTGGNGSTSTGSSPHSVDVISVNEILQLPNGTAIIQNPAVGNEKSAGAPYYRKFKAHWRAKKFKKDNYDWLDKEFRDYYPTVVDRTMASELLVKYKAIINEVLPLPAQEAPPAKKPKPKTIPAKHIIQKLTNAGYEVPGNLPEHVPVPDSLTTDGKFIPSIDNCLRLLDSQQELNNARTTNTTV
jgi:type IV secretory pathway TraG/TraD family ATPase VirD4